MATNLFVFPNINNAAVTDLLSSDSEATKLDLQLLPMKINQLLIKSVDKTKQLHHLNNEEDCDRFKQYTDYLDTVSNPEFKIIYNDAINSLKPNKDRAYFEIDTIKIKKADLIQLAPGNTTSDNVINAFSKMLCLKPFARSIKVFPSELFTSMYISNNEKYCYENVMSWNKTEIILDYEVLIFPVFVMFGHWAVVVVYMKEREMYYLDSKNYSGGDRILRCTIRFLYDESLKHCVFMRNLSDWKLYHKGIGQKQQGKNLNCGIFALLYIDMVTNGLPISLIDDSLVELYRYYVSSCFIKSTSIIDMTDESEEQEVENTETKLALSGSALLDELKPFDIITDISDYLRGTGRDPADVIERAVKENTLYVAKFYNSKPVFNAGGGVCFHLATSQTLAMSAIRSRSEVTVVNLKSSLKLGMLQNEISVREMLSASNTIPQDRNTTLKYKKWVTSSVDSWVDEHMIILASFFWNVRFEIICPDMIVVYDPDVPTTYIHKLPVPRNLLKETVRLVFNFVDHYQAIEELSESIKDTETKDLVREMNIEKRKLVNYC